MKRTIAALFQSRAEAREAIAELHRAHYGYTWLGTTTGAQSITVESGGFFSGSQTLGEALISHGISDETARALEKRAVPGNAIVTIDPKDDDAYEAIAILEGLGGIVAGAPLALAGSARTPRHGASLERGATNDIEWEEMLFQRR